jgi:hypothetical protein
MPDFIHSLNVKTRAIAPEYNSQWYDRVLVFQRVPDGIDWLDLGYPYSMSDKKIVDGPYQLDGEVNPCALLTIAGDVMFAIDGDYLRRIQA